MNNQLLYAALIWASAMAFENNIRMIEAPQRRIALRTVIAYRTVSTMAIQVIAGMIRQRKYQYMKAGEMVDEVTERERTLTNSKWQEE